MSTSFLKRIQKWTLPQRNSLKWLLPRIDENLTPSQNNRIMLMHWLLVMGSFLSILYVFINYYYQHYFIIVADVVVLLLILVGIFLGKQGLYSFQKSYSLVVGNCSLFFISIFHPYETGDYALYFPIFCAPFVIFDFREKRKMAFFASLSILLAVSIILLKRFNLLGKEGGYEVLLINTNINHLMSVITTAFIFLVFIIINEDAEEQLLRREADLNTLIENANEAIWSLTKDYHIISFNKIFSRFCQTAYQVKPKKGMFLFDSSDKDEIKFWKERYDKAMLHGRFVEEINYQRFGIDKIYQIAFSPIFDEKEGLVGVSCYAKDITKKRKVEAQNFENSQLLQKILNNVSIVVFSLDNQGNFIKVIGSGLQKVGLSEEDFKEKNIKDFPNYFGDNLLKILEETSQTIVFESHFTNKGKIWWMENFIFKNPKGGVIGCAIDITENKKVQEQLSEKNLMLEKANKELDRFVYSTSHDLRAPLKSVLGLIKLGKMDTSEPMAHQYLDLIRQNIEKLEDFIQEIIEYSRNARQEIKSEPIDFDAIFSTVVHRHQYMEGAMQINFKIEVPSYLKFFSDARRLIIVLNNLVSNAIKYHDFSKPQPFILMKVVDYPNYVEIIIQDNGSGIEKEYQDRVFDMFFRATEKSSGSGLGLYITKEIIEKLKGSIFLTSEVGVGTTMTVRLPKK